MTQNEILTSNIECNTLGNQRLPNEKAAEKLVEVLLPCRPDRTNLGAILGRLGRTPGEELIDERVNLADLGVAEMARQQRGEIVDHAPALHLADRVRRRSDEHPAVLVLAVLLVVAHLDGRRFLGVGRERLERALEGVLEIA